MKGLQKLICGFLAFVMVFAILPIPAYAEEVEPCAEDAHIWDEGVRTEATEDAPAFLTYTCTVCGQSKVEEEGPVVLEELPCEHSWDEGISSETVITYTCTLCGETKTEDIPVEEPTTCADDAHVWDEGVSSETVVTYTCTVCGATREESIEVEELYTLTDEQRNRILSRDDGEWLFPLPQEYYVNITDWNGCRGNEVCLFCGEVHSECQEPDHQDSPYGHWGLETSAPYGIEVYALRDGVAYWTDDTLILEHATESGYAYYSAFTGLGGIAITAGADVEQGKVVAYSTEKLCFAMFMAPSGQGSTIAENPDSELKKIEGRGWLEGQIGTGMIVNSPSPDSGEPECDCSAIEAMLSKHLGTVQYFFMPEEVETLEVLEPASDDVDVAEMASGTCGENLTWILDANGKLEIFGTGEMNNYESNYDVPWYDYADSIFEVVIHDGVSTIGNCAFQWCSFLTEASIPATVSAIGEQAFYSCGNLAKLNLVDGLRVIEDRAFMGCDNLTEIVIPEGTISIGWQAFDECGISTVKIPGSVKDIYGSAFRYCNNLTDVVFSEGVESIGGWMFQGCGNLTRVVVPNSVKEISSTAFGECEKLKTAGPVGGDYNIQFGWSEKIPEHAFGFCDSLTSITIPQGITTIGEGAFWDCNALTSLIIPSSVKSMSDSYGYNYNLKTAGPIGGDFNIQFGWKDEIPDYAFYDCISLTNVTLPDEIKRIGKRAFRACSELSYVSIPEGCTIIDDYAFFDCTNLLYIDLLDGISSIGESAFQNCTNLTDVVIPEGTKSILANAFYNCSNLSNITIPGSVSSLEGGAFELCGKLTTAGSEASNNIQFGWTEEIPDEAFCGCNSLTNISLPNGIQRIGNHAFAYCTVLSNISIPEGCTTIDDYAFYGCESMYSAILPDGISRIGVGLFGNCSELSKVKIPGSVTTIGGAAFSGCNNLITAGEGDEYNIQLGWKSTIPKEAFKGCTVLVSLTIPESITTIESNAFDGCKNLESVHFNEGLEHIDPHAFSDCSKLSAITIPEGVLNIESYAFYRCNSLTKVDLPESLKQINGSAFERCESLTSIFIPKNIEEIGFRAFNECSALQTIIVDDDNQEYCDVEGVLFNKGKTAIICCPGGKEGAFSIPDGVQVITTDVFRLCEKLSSVTIPGSITTIGASVFRYCRNLSNITISEGVTSIASESFYECSALTEVTIPKSVTSIGYEAFDRCSKISDVYYAGTKEDRAAITIGISNEYLENATWHYNCTGTGDSGGAGEVPEGASRSVEQFTSWDAEKQLATFNNIMDYHVTERTDMSFLDSLNELLGNYVLVTTEPTQSVSGIRTLLSIEPVDTQVGKVTAVSENSITVWEDTYPISVEMLPLLVDIGDIVMYHVYKDEVVSFTVMESQKGILARWNSETQELGIMRDLGYETCSYSLSDRVDEKTLAFLEKNTENFAKIWFIADYNGVVYRMGGVPDYGASDTFEPGESDPAMGYVFSYRDDWDEAYKSFIDAVDQALQEYAGTDEATRDRRIAAEAARMKKNDQKSSSKYISDIPNAKYTDLAYKALASYFYDVTRTKVPDLSSIDVSDTMAGVQVINNILTNIGGEKRQYTFEGIEFTVTIFDALGTFCGSMTIEADGESPEIVAVCDTQEECKASVNAFVEELQDLATNSAYNVATSVYTDILGKSLSSLTSDYLTEAAKKIEKKLAVKLAEKFSVAGVGELFNVLNESYTCYTWVKKAIDIGTKDSFEESLSEIVNLKFEDKTITNGAVKEAMRQLKGATNKLERAFNEYVEDTIVKKEESFWRMLIECPVNVRVFNSSGDQIGYIGGDEIWYTDTVYIAKKGSAKEIVMLIDEIPSLEITATGDGVMSCSFEEFDDAFMPVGRLNYYNIPLTTGKVFSVTLADDLEANKDTLAITSDNESVYADEYVPATQNATVMITCTADSEGGTVVGTGMYVRGDAVILSANPHNKYDFVGWYDGDTLVETAYIYEFTAREARKLSAKFTEVNTISVNAVAGEGGIVMGEGMYSKNSAVLLTAIAYSGYQFGGWYVGNELLSTEPEYRVVVREDITVSANFLELEHQHTYGEWTDCNDGENHSRTCSVCNETEAEAHNIVIDDAVPPTSTNPGLTEGKHCSVCNAVLVEQTEVPPLDAVYILPLTDIGDYNTVWVDGQAYTVQKNADGGSYVELPNGEAKTVVGYTYNAVGEEAHKTYPTGLKAWRLEYQDGAYTATHIPEFDNILQYKGSSIRITGNKGIRMITGVPDGKREQLIQGKLAGYTLEEYGTVLAIADQIENGSLTLGDTYAKSNYAYKRNTADAIFEHSGGLIQYTNVLVGFTMDQCDDDIAMRPYMKLSDKDGNKITLYGGIVYRSIGYIAYQNKDVYPKGSDGYNYIWDIINAVYGDNLPG